MLMTKRAPHRALGSVLAGLMPVNDAGQPPMLPSYLDRTDPSPTSPFPDPVQRPLRSGGAILHSITANGSFDPSTNGGMARYRMPDGSVRGEKLPVNTTGQSIMATPEQEAESAEIARRLGTPPDYAAILRGALGERPKMNTLQTIASIAGPMLMSLSGDQAAAMQLANQVGARGREWDERAREADLTAVKWRREDDIAERERNKPQFLSGASDQVRYDPVSGKSTVVYDAPEDWQTYATGQGFEPGTEDYFRAAEDYVLRGNGPTAFQYDRDLETVKAAARSQLERERQSNRERLRGTPSYRDLNPPPPRPRTARPNGGSGIVTVKTPQEAMKLAPGTKFRGPDGITRTRP